MRKNKWQKMKICWTLVLISISLFWIVVLRFRYLQSDFRVQMIGLAKDQPHHPSSQIYLRPIQTPFKTEYFELTEMLNETNPNNIVHDDAILVISASANQKETGYEYLLEYISNSNKENPLPFYIIRRINSIFMHTFNQIQSQESDLRQILNYFSHNFPIKKLTLLAFEESSLLLLRALSSIEYDLFSILQTVILINPFNPELSTYFSSTSSFLQQTKSIILKDQLRMKMFNSTKMLFINTLNNNIGQDEKLNWLIEVNKDQKVNFGNTVIISSKFMWNVYTYLKTNQYFRFEPFLWILTKAFNENRRKSMTAKDLQYLIVYRQLPQIRYLPVNLKRKVLAKCSDFYLEKHSNNDIIVVYDGVIFKNQCIRILRKENVYFNDKTTILISGSNKFEVYGEAFEKLVPIQTKANQYMYLLENLGEYKRFLILNRKKINIKLNIQSIILPKKHKPIALELEDFIQDLQYKNYYLKNITRKEIVRECPGFSMIFPTHFGPKNTWDRRIYLDFLQSDSQFCYIATDFLMFWIDQIIQYWALWFNLLIFTIFCTHILEQSTFSRFYVQFIVNKVLTFVAVGEILPLENMLLLTIIVLIELGLKFCVWVSEIINMPKHIAARMMWLPITFQLMRSTYFIHNMTYPSPWKIMGFQFIMLLHKKNIYILFIEAVFLFQYIRRDMQCLFSIILICMWLIVTNPKKESSNSTFQKYKQKVISHVSLIIMSLCTIEDGIYFRYATDAFIIAHIMLGIPKLFDLQK